MRTQLDHAEVWSDGEMRKFSILINDEKVEALLTPGDTTGIKVDQKIDLAGHWVLPGGIDLHTHISDGAETFLPGSSSAAAGGITTVLDIAPFHACVTEKQLIEKAALAQADCVVDFGLVAGIVIDESDLAHLAELARAGAAYFKVFQPSEPPVSVATLWKAVQAAARTGLRLGLHAEEPACLLPVGDSSDPLSFPHSRPAIAETSAVAQLIEMARAAGAPVHVCHISCGRTAELVAWGKALGVDITCEVPAQYLLLDESAFSIYGSRVKTTPPLRPRADTEQLWQALSDGVIDAIACDHYIESLTPLPLEPQNIPSSAAGIAGLEVSLPLMMDAVLNGRLSVKRFVETTAITPARLAGIPAKGRIAVGMDADFAIWDPKKSWRVLPRGDFSRLATTPFNGWMLKGQLCQTWLRGRQIWNGDQICVPAGYGRWKNSKKGE